MKCVYTNARSICNKVEEFFSFIALHEPDIIGITETWLNNEIPDGLVKPPGYSIFRSDRCDYSDNRGGGVMLLFKETIEVEQIVLTDSKETLWIKIIINQTISTYVGICYRAPENNAENNNLLLTQLQSIIDQNPSQLLLMGDFNLPHINFQLLESPNGFSNEFLNFVINNLLVQHIDFNTRFQYDKSSLLDLIITNEDDDVSDLESLPPLGKSDHITIAFNFKVMTQLEHSTPTPKDTYNYWKGNFEALNKEFVDTNWNEVLRSNNIEENWGSFKSKIFELVPKHIPPTKTIKPNKSKKARWMTQKSLESVKNKQKLFVNYTRSDSLTDYKKYTEARNNATQECKSAKSNFEKDMVNSFKDNPKLFYNYTRNLKPIKTTIPRLKRDDGSVTENDQEIAEEFNLFFQSVFVNEPDSGEHLDFDPRVGEEQYIEDLTFCEEDVRKLLLELNPSKCPGVDRLHPKMLKECPALAKPLNLIFRQSLDTSTLPSDWKSSIISPIFKKGNKAEASNYRPVSLTSIVCKMLETLIKRTLCKHISQHNLLSPDQHGFTPGRSCLTNLLETLEIWTKAIDEGKQIDCIYLDYSKAFDSVPFMRLLIKMKAYGVTGKVLEWIRNFLVGRQMKVSIRGQISSSIEVTSGVPQGSVLGPLLFLMYVNEIPSILQSTTKVFADDTKVFRVIESKLDNDQLQNDLNTLTSWSNSWLLRLNPDKCKVMHVSSHRRQNSVIKTQYQVGDDRKELMTTDSEKDLGVWVDKIAKPNIHCAHAIQKANKMIRLIGRCFNFINIESLRILWKCFIRPHVDYCAQIWCPYTKRDIQMIEGVQKRATKLAPQLKNLNYEERLKALDLTSLESRRLRGDLIETFKMLKGISNINPDQFFTLDSTSRCRGHTLKLKKPRANTLYRQSFFSHRVVDPWNALPQKVIDARTTNQFKNLLDKHMKTQREANTSQ